MKVRFIELPEPLREGGLEKAAADMAYYLNTAGVEVVRGDVFESLDSFDLVHFHGLWSPAHFRMARFCRKKGIPTIVSPHGMLEPWAWKHRRWKKWPYFHLLEKRRLQWANALLATADTEAGNLRRFFPDARIETIPLGIEPDIRPDYDRAREQLGWDTGERVLLYLSRIHPKKGLKELLEALLRLPEEVHLERVRLVIVGDGPQEYTKACEQLTEKLLRKMSVDWIPPKWGKGKWPFLQGADLFCLPTYSENFGIVVLEAGIVGTPVFTTTGTPWKEIEHAGFGWVVEPDIRNYGPVLREFLSQTTGECPGRRDSFAEWTRLHYAWPNIISRYMEFYESVLSTDA